MSVSVSFTRLFSHLVGWGFLGLSVGLQTVGAGDGLVVQGYLPTGNFPRSVTVLPGGDELLVSHNSQDDSHFLRLISLGMARENHRIPVLSGVHNSLAVNVKGDMFLVPNEQGGFVSQCSRESGLLRHRVFGRRIIQVANSPDFRTIYVLAELQTGKSALFSLNTDAFSDGPEKRIILDGLKPAWCSAAMVAAPDGSRVYIVSTPRPPIVPFRQVEGTTPGDSPDLSMTQIDPGRMVIVSHREVCLKKVFPETLPRFTNRTVIPGGLAVGTAGADAPSLFVAQPAYGVFAIDVRNGKILWRMGSRDYPSALAFCPFSSRLLTVCRRTDSLLIMNARDGQVEHRIGDVAADPIAVAVNSTEKAVYVAGTFSNRITVLKPGYLAGEAPENQQARSAPPGKPLRDRIIFLEKKNKQQIFCSLAADGSDFRRHLKTSMRITSCVFSPDGQWLVLGVKFSQGSDLFCYDWRQRKLRRLTYRGAGRNPFESTAQEVSWYPDRRRILFVTWRTHTDSVVYSMRPDGTGEMRIHDDFGDHNDFPIAHPFNPDIILYFYDDGNWVYHRELRIFNRLSGARHTLVPNDGMGMGNVDFLADGQLVFTRSTGGYRTPGKVIILNPITGERREIARGKDLKTQFSCANPRSKQTLVWSITPLSIGVINLSDGTKTNLPAPRIDAASSPRWARVSDDFLEAPLLDLDPLFASLPDTDD